MLEVSVDSTAMMAKLTVMPEKVRSALARQVARTAVQLQRYIVKEHLNAPVGFSATMLHVQTGRLARSIQQRTTVGATAVEGRVFSAGDVPYARIHEYGGVTSPHVIEPKNATVLSFMSGGVRVFAKKVNHPGSNIPERSYMRASLKENREKIIRDMTNAVREGLKT